MDTQKIAEENLILKVRTGSFLYGTETENSDVDYVGVCIPPKDVVFGLYKFDQYIGNTNSDGSGVANTKEDVDITIYSLTKFIELVSANNPNILEIIFAPKENIVFIDEYGFGSALLSEGFKDMVVSQLVANRFMGYATAQKKKLLRPPDQKTGSRVSMIEEYGYDLKFASHLVRLLSFGIELLETGKLSLPAKNATILKEIKTGFWTLEAVLALVESLEEVFREEEENSPLRKTPDRKKVSDFLVYLMETYWKTFPEKART